jgi:hypothetical protein
MHHSSLVVKIRKVAHSRQGVGFLSVLVVYAFDYDGSRCPCSLIGLRTTSFCADRDALNAPGASGASSGTSNGAPYGVSEEVELSTIVVIRVDTDQLGTAGALNSRMCKTACVILTSGSAGLWDPMDSRVHHTRPYWNSNCVMTLPSRPTNHLFRKIWHIRQLLHASQPPQLQVPQILQLQVNHHHGPLWLRIPT